MALDIEALRSAFPALRGWHGAVDRIYLDSAASALRPQGVIDAVSDYYSTSGANVHRGVHAPSLAATEAFEGARRRVAEFIGARAADELVFTSGATQGLNLVARAWAAPRLGPGDELLVSELEHHSNLIPWQMVAKATGARLVCAPINDAGELDRDAFAERCGERTRVVALTHVSNALGTVVPIADLTEIAHRAGAVVVVDGAQAAPHLPLDLEALGVDFYALSGHKLYGPSGIGVLYGRAERLAEMDPWLGGGEMIKSVRFDDADWADPPRRFEAGTPNIAGAIGLGAAVDWLGSIDREALGAHEHEVYEHARALLAEIPSVEVLGKASERTASLSFLVDGTDPHTVGTFLDQEGICVRTGLHCAEPLMSRFGADGSIRASFGPYNTMQEAELLADMVRQTALIFGGTSR